jgi:hypothetical protein
MSAIIQPQPSPALMSPSTCFSNDHSIRTGSPPLELHVSRSVTAETLGSCADSLGSTAASSTPQWGSLANLQLIVDHSFYHL